MPVSAYFRAVTVSRAPGTALESSPSEWWPARHAMRRTNDVRKWSIAEPLARFLQDARYTLRSLVRLPSYAITVVLTLAVSIAATAAMFTVVKSTLLDPLPYPQQDRLIELLHEAPGIGIDELHASPAIYFAYRDHGRSFESVGLWDWDASPATLNAGGEPESVRSVEATHEVLAMLGAKPFLGRLFTDIDDRPGSPQTLVISYDYWQRRFGGADVLGRTVLVEQVPRELIGVLPESFTFFAYDADIFYSLQLERSSAIFPAFDGRGIGRLKPGVTLEEANADAARIAPMLQAEFGRPLPGFEDARFGQSRCRIDDGGKAEGMGS
jgi:hypothetical protein